MLKQVFLAHLEPMITSFGPWKLPKCLENGLFWDQNCVKKGSKPRFSKSDPKPFWMFKQVFLAHLEPMITSFDPWKLPKCLENGLFWDQNCVKKGSKPRFSKSDPKPFWMFKQVFFARFEPVVTGFGRWKVAICLEKGPLWGQNWAKNGSNMRFSKSDTGPLEVHPQVFGGHF